MSNILKIAGAGVSAAAEETDENFNQTVLLLHGDNTNGAQNNTFLDSSTNNFTITRNGNTTQGTFSPFSAPDGRWSNYFDGETNSYLNTPATGQFAPTGDFTIGWWYYPVVFQTSVMIANYTGNNTTDWSFETDSTGDLNIYLNGSTQRITGSAVLNLNQWNYIVVSRSGSTVTAYCNGSSVGTFTLSGTFGSATKAIRIGAGSAGTNNAEGYISNVYLLDGTALDGTLPTTPFTDGTGVSLLTCQSNRFVDNATPPNAITVNSTGVKVTPFSPFAPTAAYDASVNGGSGYFDGTGDYLSVADDADFDFGTGDFTVSGWLYKTTAANALGMMVIDGRAADNTAGWVVYEKGDGTLEFWQSSAILTSSSALIPNQWNYFHISRSGSSAAMYINGSSAASATNTTSLVSHGLNIGAKQPSASTIVPWQGYLAEISVVKGTATSNAVPTAPTTAIANTSLLLNFTNAGIFDQTGKNNLETVADAQIDTTTKKYGTGSMEFDGTGDYLLLKDNENFIFGTGDFTIEFWVYSGELTTSTIDPNFIDFRPASTNGVYPSIFYDASESNLVFYVSAANRIDGGALSENTWYHIAVARSGTSTKMFVDGVQVGSTYTDTNNYLCGTNRPVIAAQGFSPTNVDRQLNGLIDDLRITKGVARYTTTFTPPTKAFPDL